MAALQQANVATKCEQMVMQLEAEGYQLTRAEEVAELVASNLFEKCDEGYRILKYEEWQMTSEEEREVAAKAAERRVAGRESATKRWHDWSASPPEDGFDFEKNFADAWEMWPPPADSKFQESRGLAFEAFQDNITNAKDYDAFSQALMSRMRAYKASPEEKSRKRMFLGAFKNFCTKWQGWIPKSYKPAGEPAPVPVSGAPAIVEKVAPVVKMKPAYIDPSLVMD